MGADESRLTTTACRRSLRRIALGFVACSLLVAGCAGRRDAQYRAEDAVQAQAFANRRTGDTQLASLTEVTPLMSCGSTRQRAAAFERGEVIPVRPAPGREINHRFVYVACQAPNAQVSGTLTRRLTYGRAVLVEEKTPLTLKPGRWAVDVFIGIPPNADIGW